MEHGVKKTITNVTKRIIRQKQEYQLRKRETQGLHRALKGTPTEAIYFTSYLRSLHRAVAPVAFQLHKENLASSYEIEDHTPDLEWTDLSTNYL